MRHSKLRFISLLAAAALLGCTACALDIPLEDKVSDPKAISNLVAMQRATAAAYLSYHWQDYNLGFSILSDDFMPSGWMESMQPDRMRYLWNDQRLLDDAANLWKEHYSTITLCNTVIERVDEVQAHTDEEIKTRDALHGAVLLLSARCYLQLLQVYAAAPNQNSGLEADGIVLRDRVAFELLPRSSVRQSLQAIENRINKALALLKDNTIKIEGSNAINWLGYDAGLLLLAQTALWSGNYEKALTAANELLERQGSLIQGDAKQRYEAMWSAKAPGDALYAHDQSDKQQGVRLYLKETQYDSDRGDLFSTRKGTELESNDVRKPFYEVPFTMDGGVRMLWGKYNYMNRHQPPIEFKETLDLRLSEALFIKAECLARNGQEDPARNLLNKWLKTLNATEIPSTTTGKNLIDKILFLKMQEFRGEGHSYFDAKRTRKPMPRYDKEGKPIGFTIQPNDYRWLWPLPMEEVRTNDQIKQNTGWEFVR